MIAPPSIQTARAKIAAGIAAAIVMFAGGDGGIRLGGINFRGTSNPAGAATTQPAAWESQFNAIYHIADGQTAKYVAPPFIAARLAYYKAHGEKHNLPQGPDFMFFHQARDGTLDDPYELFDHDGSGAPGMSIHDVTCRVANLRTWQITGDAKLLQTKLPGDWIVRTGAAADAILPAVTDALNSHTGLSYEFTHSKGQREVVTVIGPVPPNQPQIKLEVEGTAHRRWGGIEPLDVMLDQLTDFTGIDFVNNTLANPALYNFFNYDITFVPDTGKTADQKTDDLLHTLGDQTGLIFQRQTQPVDIWTLGPVTQPGAAADWQPGFKAVYGLAEGQKVALRESR